MKHYLSTFRYRFVLFLTITIVAGVPGRLDSESLTSNFSTENLVAWCIVPFDAEQRNPEQRADMLRELELGRSAYDWRQQHVKEFEEEIRQYKRQGIEFFAFWSEHEEAFKLFKKHNIHPQIWKTPPNPEGNSQKEKVTHCADKLESLAKRTKELKCKLGLYNHGGWSGEPQNLIAVCEELRRRGFENVGIVYNWHHGHHRIQEWEEDFRQLRPYLLCLNLNGMNNDATPKILSLGKGQHEKEMLRVVVESGYAGPIGILDHRNEMDAKKSLQENIDGLKVLLSRIREGE